MIAVIADDFTGAAEIGGIGLRHGLSVIIETRPTQHHQADLLIIAADTRSLPPPEAAAQIGIITRQLMRFQPGFIFKKLDSVLRGNITAELVAQMEVSGKNRSIVVAANPVFQRIIRNGMYYVDHMPLNKTHFSSDPEYPITSASVLEIVKTEEKVPLINLKPGDALPEKGLIFGDVVDQDDLEQWAMRMDNDTLLAGASGFFNAILSKQTLFATHLSKKSLASPKFRGKALFVLGSTFSKDMHVSKHLNGNGHYLSNMPKEIYYNRHFAHHSLDQWADDIVKAFREHQKVIVTIAHARSSERNIEFRIRENIGALIKRVVEKVDLNELLLEGGNTTSAVLRHLEIKKLWPIQELDTGVIRMKIGESSNFYLTTKPGSYFWPEHLWISQDIQRFNMNNVAYD